MSTTLQTAAAVALLVLTSSFLHAIAANVRRDLRSGVRVTPGEWAAAALPTLAVLGAFALAVAWLWRLWG
jgi:hypothetical protein